MWLLPHLMRDDDGDEDGDGDQAVLGPDIKVAYWHHLHTFLDFEKQKTSWSKGREREILL